MSGVPQATVNRWLSEPNHPGTPAWLNPLWAMNLKLNHEIYKPRKTGRVKVSPIPAKAASKFINLVARHLKTAEAFDTIDAIGEIGLNSYIQGKTGWLPNEHQSSHGARESVNRILNAPCPYAALYYKELCDRAFGWFGCQFYWDYFYCWMTDEERCSLDKQNPPINGHRKTRIHQWIEPTTKERLRDKAIELGALILAARSKQQFIELFQNRYGDGWQMDIFN